jgi:hypothetical protein
MNQALYAHMNNKRKRKKNYEQHGSLGRATNVEAAGQSLGTGLPSKAPVEDPETPHASCGAVAWHRQDIWHLLPPIL